MPRWSASWLNVVIFRNPSRRKDSVNEVRPSRVLVTTARAKRWLTRAPSVRWKLPPLPAGTARRRSTSSTYAAWNAFDRRLLQEQEADRCERRLREAFELLERGADLAALPRPDPRKPRRERVHAQAGALARPAQQGRIDLDAVHWSVSTISRSSELSGSRRRLDRSCARSSSMGSSPGHAPHSLMKSAERACRSSAGVRPRDVGISAEGSSPKTASPSVNSRILRASISCGRPSLLKRTIPSTVTRRPHNGRSISTFSAADASFPGSE